jgi:mycoredoxin
VGLISRLFRGDGEAQQIGPQPGERCLADPPAVTLYTTGWCADCFMAKRYLQQKGVAYREIDIERTPGAAQEVMRLANGNRTVPTLKIGDTVVIDWDQRAVAAALAAAGLV